MGPRGIFVTGTDTGVGKTVVAALLTLGLEGEYWKPIQCGLEPQPPHTDRECVARWTGLPPERLLPEAYLLRLPASPHLAAQREGVRIELAAVTTPPCRLPGAVRPLVVEGAGGLLVPLNERDLMIDLIARLGLPVVLVARSSLGTINHTLLSLEALRVRGLPLAGVIVNGPRHPDNERAIAAFGGLPPLGALPPLPRLEPATLRAAYEEMRRPLEERLTAHATS